MSDLDAIRDRLDIVELVGETVRLQRSGRAYKGLCPFHTEKTPSFTVSPERRTWHCFGSCATGGDVFSFVMRRDNLDFGEAVRTLAARAGIDYQLRGPKQESVAPRLISANESAAGFFQHVLLNSGEAGPARTYAEQRGVSAEAIRDFEIGYAPDSWDALASRLRTLGYEDGELVQAGLLVQSERGVHDRFRARLIFPIRDSAGKIVGFGGRSLGDGTPKYLNSPQSPVFDKSSLLYALDRAHDAIRQAGKAVLVEGYMDAIAAHQHGYTNVVATLGTALNERHITLLKRYTRFVALALDADEAGLEATLRGEQLIREMTEGERIEVVVDWGNLVRVQTRAPVEVRIFSVPSGKDPDEAIRADPSGWPEWVAAALPPFEFRLRVELSRLDRSNPRQRMELLDRMLPLLSEVGDRTLQAHYLSQLATSLGVRENDIRMRLNAAFSLARRGSAVAVHEPLRVEQPLVAGASVRIERFCLALLLRFEELRGEGVGIRPDVFTSSAQRQLFELWREGDALDEASVADPLRDEWLALTSLRMVPAVMIDPLGALDDCLRRLELRRLEDQKRLLTALLTDDAEQDTPGDEEVELDAQSSAADVDGRLRDDIEAGLHLHRLEYRLRTGRSPLTAESEPEHEDAPDVPSEAGTNAP